MFNFNITPSTAYSTIQEWEEAGASLQKALSSYLKLSAAVGKISLVDGAPSTYLAEKIESVLESVYPALDQQLAESRSSLAQMRNRLIPPIHRLPEEVLSHIFLHVVPVLDPPEYRNPWSVKERVLERYKPLHTILGVCTLWRNAALARGDLWSVLPCFWGPGSETGPSQALECIIRRSKGVDLTLSAMDSCFAPADIPILAAHASRFQAVDITASFSHGIREIMEPFADQSVSGRSILTQLSIHREYNNSGALPEEDDYIFGTTSQQELYNRLFSQLSTLQIRGSLLYWDKLPATERLTTFHLQDVVLGQDWALINLLKALSAATQLRELKLVKVKTYLDSSPPDQLLRHSKVWLPNLKSLFVRGLYFNTWRLILLSIRSQSHRLSFVFSNKSRRIIRGEDRDNDLQNVDIQTICGILGKIPVHALLLHKKKFDTPGHVVSPGELEKLLGATPSLETLWMNVWYLSRRYCRALHRSRKNHPHNLRSLVNLYFSCVNFRSPETFKNMISGYSRSVQRVVLGGPPGRIARRSYGGDYVDPEGELVCWLKQNVPETHVYDSEFEPPEFRGMLWQELW